MVPASVAGHVLELLMLAERSPGPVDRLVSGFLRDRPYLGSRDRRAISDLLFGMIRHRRRLEALLEEFLRLHPEYAAIDVPRRRYASLIIACAVARPGVPGSLPGLFTAIPPPEGELRSIWDPYFPGLDPSTFVGWLSSAADLPFIHESPAVTLAVKHSFQDWMVEEWAERWPGEVEPLLEALNGPGAVWLRVNTLRTDRDACLARLAAEGVTAETAPYPDTALLVRKRFNQNALASFKEGWFEIQDLGSQAVAAVCAPGKEALVVDVCAGAGGKTLHLAALMGNTGRIFAADSDPARLKELGVRARRAGASNIHIAQKQNLPGDADLVLVDAPCSGSGTIRRNPSMKWSIREEDLARYASLQLDILSKSAPLVKPGGRLVYSTCSLFRRENEEVVAAFLAAHGEFAATDLPAQIPWGTVGDDRTGVTLLPHRLHADGFFIASMTRSRE